MALRDTACYTLTLRPSPTDRDMLELVEPSVLGPGSASGGAGKAETRYVRMRESREGEAYSGAIYDALSGAKLASMGFGGHKDKKRRMDLHGPDESVGFEYTGKINFEWSFVFEEWTREVYGKDYICAIDRKPDPRVEVCLARDADSKNPGRLQILHYNLDRFSNEIKDLRGLETLLVASLMMIVDAAEERNRSSSSTQRPTLSNTGSSSSPPGTAGAPPPPEKPAKVISEEDYEPENPNEIVVGMQTDIDGHVARAIGLLEDPQTLFIVIRTRNAAAAQRALEVSLGVKRFRHREGLADLYQYVIEEEPFKASKEPLAASSSSNGRNRPAVINLDDPAPAPKPAKSPEQASTKWSSPPNIAIYMSKIELPDLKPGRRETLKAKQSAGAVQDRTDGAAGSGNSTMMTDRPRPDVGAMKLQRPQSTAPTTVSSPSAGGMAVRPPPPVVPSRPPPPSATLRPPPPASASMPGAWNGQNAGGSGGQTGSVGSAGSNEGKSKPGGGVSLTRLFKAAASKV